MRRQHAGLALGFAVPALAVAALFLSGADTAPRGPTQPIAFSHKLHAGQYQIACQYCHYSADRSPWVNIAPVELCMGCHKLTAAQRPEIQKLTRYWNDKQAIPWVRVHHLPELAKFNHKRHIRAGFSCQTCHGPVQEMDVVYQFSTLSMNWCINCHNGQNELGKKASVDCLTCHY
jgi:hypothetical protein